MHFVKAEKGQCFDIHGHFQNSYYDLDAEIDCNCPY